MEAFALHLNEQNLSFESTLVLCEKEGREKRSVDVAAINGGSVKSEGCDSREAVTESFMQRFQQPTWN